MCGIVACIQLGGGKLPPETNQQLKNSLKQLHHRGPDNHGAWQSDDGRVGFAHARLSIRDLSERGRQPLLSTAHDIAVIVNGELYDQAALRSELSADYTFQSNSDSEVLIPLYLKYGINLFSRLRGEFSFCLYDARRQLLLAARDRYGIKPLHWTVQGDRLLVASEAKALLPLGWRPLWDVKSVVEDGWMHDERTLFKGVRKLRPGHYLMCSSFEYIERRQYWELEYPDKNVVDPRSEEEMIQGVRERLVDAVSARLASDVPVGIYLSGGIDSAVVAGIMNDLRKARPSKRRKLNSGSDRLPSPDSSDDDSRNNHALDDVKCFTVGFDERTEFDEASIAQRTADWLDLPLVVTQVDEEKLADNFAAATWHSEHHNADLQYVGKFLLSKAARDAGYRVILSGEGSDEHLGGYMHFLPDFLREPDNASPAARQLSAEKLQLESRRAEDAVVSYKGADAAGGSSAGSSGAATPTSAVSGSSASSFDDNSVARRILNNASIASKLWRITVASFSSWTQRAFGGPLSVQRMRAETADPRILQLMNSRWHPLHTAQYIWTRSVLPNAILTCMGDRMEMAHSIEGRPPFMDHRLTEYLNGLPPSVKIRTVFDGDDQPRFVEKWILREAARPFINDEMYYRKKHPFTAPVLYARGDPMHRTISGLVTREAVEGLGFVDWLAIEPLLDVAFAGKAADQEMDEDDVAKRMAAMRVLFTTAQFVVLSQRFGIPRATPPE